MLHLLYPHFSKEKTEAQRGEWLLSWEGLRHRQLGLPDVTCASLAPESTLGLPVATLSLPCAASQHAALPGGSGRTCVPGGCPSWGCVLRPTCFSCPGPSGRVMSASPRQPASRTPALVTNEQTCAMVRWQPWVSFTGLGGWRGGETSGASLGA